jgi:hypothetical protein
VDNNQNIDTEQELNTTKALLDITRNKLFTAISTITELELIVAIEREKNKQLAEQIEQKDTNS